MTINNINIINMRTILFVISISFLFSPIMAQNQTATKGLPRDRTIPPDRSYVKNIESNPQNNLPLLIENIYQAFFRFQAKSEASIDSSMPFILVNGKVILSKDLEKYDANKVRGIEIFYSPKYEAIYGQVSKYGVIRIEYEE